MGCQGNEMSRTEESQEVTASKSIYRKVVVYLTVHNAMKMALETVIVYIHIQMAANFRAADPQMAGGGGLCQCSTPRNSNHRSLGNWANLQSTAETA